MLHHALYVSREHHVSISVDMDTLFKESDFVTAHTALTPETAGKTWLGQYTVFGQGPSLTGQGV